MPQDSVVATDQPSYRTSSLITVTSAQAYDAAVPTATIPSTTSQTFLIPSNNGDKPSLLRLVPFCGSSSAPTSSTFTSPGVRVVGWSVYTKTDGSDIYVPTILADLSLTLLSSSAPSLSVDGATQYYFSTVTAGSGVPTVNLYSPGSSVSSPAVAVIDTIGHRYITLQFKANNANSPKMGSYYSFL